MNNTNEIIEKLYQKLDAQDAIIDQQALEISQLKEQLENDIDRYEDTISYQLGFDKGKEYLQQRIDKAIKYIKDNALYEGSFKNYTTPLLEILGDKENE